MVSTLYKNSFEERGKIMRNLKLSTKAGQRVYDMGKRWAGDDLYQCYDNPSDAKLKAFDWCYEAYLATEDSEAFSICSYNTFAFTCSWLGKMVNEKTGTYEDILRVETKDNTYIVWLEQ